MLGQERNAAGRRGSIINVASLLSFQWVFSSLFSPNWNGSQSPGIVVPHSWGSQHCVKQFNPWTQRGNANYNGTRAEEGLQCQRTLPPKEEYHSSPRLYQTNGQAKAFQSMPLPLDTSLPR